ncbi:MAG: hypothetical protein IJ481_01155 [Alphaproteobacteria bacterium]|nr:hypothetical protein [Alphaproteobacteria bacterium]
MKKLLICFICIYQYIAHSCDDLYVDYECEEDIQTVNQTYPKMDSFAVQDNISREIKYINCIDVQNEEMDFYDYKSAIDNIKDKIVENDALSYEKWCELNKIDKTIDQYFTCDTDPQKDTAKDKTLYWSNKADDMLGTERSKYYDETTKYLDNSYYGLIVDEELKKYCKVYEKSENKKKYDLSFCMHAFLSKIDLMSLTDTQFCSLLTHYATAFMGKIPYKNINTSKDIFKIGDFGYDGFIATLNIFKQLINNTPENKQQDKITEIINTLFTKKCFSTEHKDEILKNIKENKLTLTTFHGGARDFVAIVPYNKNEKNKEDIIKRVDRLKNTVFQAMNDSGLLGFLNTVIVEITDPYENIFEETPPISAYTPNGNFTLQQLDGTTCKYQVFKNFIGRRNVINSLCIVNCVDLTDQDQFLSQEYKISKCDFAKGHEVDEFGVLKNITVENSTSYYWDILNNALKKNFTNSAKAVRNGEDLVYIINQTDNKNDKDIILSSIDLVKAPDLQISKLFNVMFKTKKDKSHNNNLQNYIEDTLHVKTIRIINIVNHDYIKASFTFAFDKADTALKVLNDLNINYTIDENKYKENQELPINSQEKLYLSNNYKYAIKLTGQEKVKKETNQSKNVISIFIPTTQAKYTDDFLKIMRLNNDFHKNKRNDNETLNDYVFNTKRLNIIDDADFKSIKGKRDTVFKCYIKDVTDKSSCYFYETDNSNTDENIIILKPIELKFWISISSGNMKTTPDPSYQEKIQIISKSNAEKLKKEQKRSLYFYDQGGHTHYKIYGFKNENPEYIFCDGMCSYDKIYEGIQYIKYFSTDNLATTDIPINDLDTK